VHSLEEIIYTHIYMYTHTHTHAHAHMLNLKLFATLVFLRFRYTYIIHLQEVYYSWLHSMWAINTFWWSDVGRILQQCHALYCLASRTCTFKVRDWRKFYKYLGRVLSVDRSLYWSFHTRYNVTLLSALYSGLLENLLCLFNHNHSFAVASLSCCRRVKQKII
jgi:hypothetical protein